MSWAQQRKATYTLSFVTIIVIILIIIFFTFFNKKATCSDSVQNQGETGIDCGGPCSMLCRADYTSPTVLWVRWAKILKSGTYNLLAYAENPNIGVGASNVPYTFKIYDKDNILLYTKTGSASIPANNNFVVFESGIDVHDKVPARVDFQFSNQYAWQKVANLEQYITVASKTVSNESTSPKVFATLKNSSLNQINNIQSVAILYDQDGNAIAFSKTLTDGIASGSTADIVFTWPEIFSNQVQKIDIVSQVLAQ